MVSISDEVELTNERIGRVRYVGPLDGKNGIFYGIELTQGTGKHNGSHRGKRYFQCNKGKGIFVTKKNLKYKLEPTAKNKDEKKKKTASKKAGPSQKKKSKSGKKEKFTMPDYMDILNDDTGFLEYIPRHRGNLQSKTIYPTAGYLPFAQRRKKLYKQDINDVQQEIARETAMIEFEKLRIQSKQKELDKKAESMNDQQRKEADKQRIALQEESDRLKKFDTKRQQKRDEIEAERKKLRLWEMEMAENMEKEEKDRLDQLKKEQMRRKMMLKKQKELERQRSRLADLQKESETKQRIAIQEEMAQIEAAKDASYKEEAIHRRMAEEKELERQAKWEREEADRLRALRAAQDALKLKMEAEQLRLEEERMRMEREREIKRKLELEKLKNEQERTQLLEKQKREIEDMKNMLERLKIEQEQTAKRKLEQEEAMLAKLEKKRAELDDARTALKTEMIKMAQLEKERKSKINDDVVMDKEKRLEKENGLKRMNDGSDMIGSSDESDDEEMIRRARLELEPYREREREICVCNERRRMPGNIPECGLHHCGRNEFDDKIQRKSLPEYNPIYPTPKASVSEPEEAKNDGSYENGLEDDAGSGSEKDDYNGAVSELKNRKRKESKAALRDYKIFFSVNIETKENDKDIIGDTKSLRPLLSDLFDTYSENDVFEIKTRQKGNGFKIDFGIIIATSMHPADYIDTFDDLTMDGSFQETIQNGFNLTNNPIIHIWEARYEKIDPNKQRKRKN